MQVAAPKEADVADGFNPQKDNQDELDRVALESILEDVKNFKGFDVDFDLSGKRVRFMGHVMGEGKNDASDRISVLVYDVNEPGKVLGAIRMQLYQWVELKMTADGLHTAHMQYLAAKKATEGA